MTGVRPATAADVAAIAATLAAAFDGYAWGRWTVPEADRRGRLERMFLVSMARVTIPYGEVWVTDGCEAVAAWKSPDPVVPAAVARAVEAEVARLAGDRAERMRQAEAAAAGLRPDRRHRYLEVLGTRPDRQGRGLGGAVLGPGLARSDHEGLLAWTDTSSEENVAFYARLGFTVRATGRLPGGGPPLWALGREPRGERA